MTLSLEVRLLRGFAIDFLTAHDVTAAKRIMDPAYRLSIGGHVFDGRDSAYLPATTAQLDQFPGLCVTVHDLIIGLDRVAMRFSEHGVSIRDPGQAAVWGGVTLFRIEAGRLREGWAEEDYFARKRQLKTGVCDPVLAPHPSPWDTPCSGPDAATESAARTWLETPGAVVDGRKTEQIIAEGPSFSDLVAPDTVTVNHLFSAGNRAAFHLDVAGRYRGGFHDIAARLVGTPILLRMAGILTVTDGAVGHVQVSADRLGLHRQLLGASRAP